MSDPKGIVPFLRIANGFFKVLFLIIDKAILLIKALKNSFCVDWYVNIGAPTVVICLCCLMERGLDILVKHLLELHLKYFACLPCVKPPIILNFRFRRTSLQMLVCCPHPVLFLLPSFLFPQL